MRKTRAAALLPWLALLLGGSAAAARAQEASATATIENRPEGGAVFSLSGTAPAMPDGTALHVTLLVKGDFPTPIEAAFFQVVVQGKAFSARQEFPNQTFAPLEYRAKVDLLVSEQSRPIRNWLMKEFGFGFEHRELLAVSDVAIGSAEEQAAFQQETLLALRGFVRELQGLQQQAERATSRPKDRNPDWATGERELVRGLRRNLQQMRGLLGKHVVWREAHLIDGIKNCNNELARVTVTYGEGGSVREELARVKQNLADALQQVDSRLPRDAVRQAEEKEREGSR